MTSRLATARTQLVEAVQAHRPEAPWRVHEYEPAQITAPSIFVGSPSLAVITLGQATRIVQATFPVYIVVDGVTRSQQEALDDQIAAVWDAAFQVGEPLDATPTPIDVGGSFLAGVIVRVDIPIRALTLCPPTLEAAANG